MKNILDNDFEKYPTMVQETLEAWYVIGLWGDQANWLTFSIYLQRNGNPHQNTDLWHSDRSVKRIQSFYCRAAYGRVQHSSQKVGG